MWHIFCSGRDDPKKKSISNFSDLHEQNLEHQPIIKEDKIGVPPLDTLEIIELQSTKFESFNPRIYVDFTI